MLDTNNKTEFTLTDYETCRGYRKRSYYKELLLNDQFDSEEHPAQSKKLKAVNERMQTEQLDAKQMSEAQKRVNILSNIEIFPKITSPRLFSSDTDEVCSSSKREKIKFEYSFNQTAYLPANNNYEKLAPGLVIRPCWYNSYGKTSVPQKTTVDYVTKSKSSNRFKDDGVLNTVDFTISNTNRSTQLQRDSNSSSNTFELENFFRKYSEKQHFSEESKWENDIWKVADSVDSENSSNCFKSLGSPFTDTFESLKFTKEKRKKYIQTSLLRYFKQNKSLKAAGGSSRLHKNNAKWLIKSINNSMLTSATRRKSCLIGKYLDVEILRFKQRKFQLFVIFEGK